MQLFCDLVGWSSVLEVEKHYLGSQLWLGKVALPLGTRVSSSINQVVLLWRLNDNACKWSCKGLSTGQGTAHDNCPCLPQKCSRSQNNIHGGRRSLQGLRRLWSPYFLVLTYIHFSFPSWTCWLERTLPSLLRVRLGHKDRSQVNHSWAEEMRNLYRRCPVFSPLPLQTCRTHADVGKPPGCWSHRLANGWPRDPQPCSKLCKSQAFEVWEMFVIEAYRNLS